MILVLGGTSDSVEIAGEIFRITEEVILSTASEYGYQVSRSRFPGQIVYGKMDREELKSFLSNHRITHVVDATHPYAENVSVHAISACRELGVEYLRFERPLVWEEERDVLTCTTPAEAGKLAEQLTGKIFVTIGVNKIQEVLAQITDRKRILVRVLPQSGSLVKLESLGLNADHIIAMKGPFSEEMNYLMLKESQAGVLVCKESGPQGGTGEKIKAARRLGVKVILIKRPDIDYPCRMTAVGQVKDYFVRRLQK